MNLKDGWKRLTANWQIHVEKNVPLEELDNSMRRSSFPSYGFFFLLTMSGSIATFGLLSNSAPAIIGAMIIAPLMSPILSLAHGLIILRMTRIIRSILTVTAGVIVVIVLSLCLAEFIGIAIIGSEIYSRTQPTMLDLGVAIAAGASGAFAQSRSSVLNSIAGVAIAVALVPPLAVTGIGLAIGPITGYELDNSLKNALAGLDELEIAEGAFLLFLTNLIAIVFSAGIVMLIQGYGTFKKGVFGMTVMLVFMLFLLKPLGESLNRIYIESQARKIAGELVRTNSALKDSHSRVESVNVRYIDEQLYIYIKATTPENEIEQETILLESVQRELSKDLGEPVYFQVSVTPVDLDVITIGPK